MAASDQMHPSFQAGKMIQMICSGEFSVPAMSPVVIQDSPGSARSELLFDVASVTSH